MKRKTALVTGGSGYIGSHLTQRLVRDGFETIVFDIKRPHKSMRKIVTHINGDIRDDQSFLKACTNIRPHTIIHLAASIHNPISEREQKDQREVNVLGTKSVLEALARVGCHNFIFASSAAVYGESQNSIKESLPMHPKSAYGDTKTMGELIIQEYATKYNIRAVILRLFNVAGYATEVALPNRVDQRDSLVANIAKVLLGKRKRLTIFGQAYKTKDGTATRDFVHVLDVVDAFIGAIRCVENQNKIITANIGSGVGTTNLEVVRWMERHVKHNVPIQFARSRNTEIGCSVADISVAKRVLRWNPHRSNTETITRSACVHYGLIK